MELEYTSQTRYTQLSWIHNVMMVQALIKDVRIKCPKIRYNFITGDDLTTYQKDVQAVLDTHTSEYNSIEMVYQKDSNYEANKIYYAYINVKFKDFVQSEIFKICALKNS
jgi:hypothetical protein